MKTILNFKEDFTMDKNQVKSDQKRVTRKNRIIAIVILILGLLTPFIDGDVTVALVSLLVGLPLFFSKKKWFD